MSNHEAFLGHLAESKSAVEYVASWLGAQGYTVEIPLARAAPNHASWREYKDAGDLFVTLRRRLEVKHLSVDWTGRMTWPFGDRFIVCAKHSYDIAAPKPYAYIYLSRDMVHAAIVNVEKTRARWFVDSVRDSRYAGPEAVQATYLVNSDFVEWWRLDKGPRVSDLSPGIRRA